MILGVDPGLRGAWALVPQTRPLSLYRWGLLPIRNGKFDSSKWFQELGGLKEWITVAVIEEPLSIRGRAVGSIATLFKNYGLCLQALLDLTPTLPVRTISPGCWQALAYANAPGVKKERSFWAVKKLFRRKIPNHDGIADAALIAWWEWSRKNGGGSDI